MGEPRCSVRAARPWHGCGLQHPDAALRVSPEAFWRGASTAWGHLQPEERRAIRATCRNGRQLHDRRTTDLGLGLGLDPTQLEGPQQQQQEQPPLPESRALLQAARGHGARLPLQPLVMRFDDAQDDNRQAKLLAALEASSGRPLTRLELEGAVPLSGAVAEAVTRCCPQLEGLRLVHKSTGHSAGGPPSEEEAFEYDYGCMQLLTLCGPRLTDLRLLGVHRWQALSYMALRRCTALTNLELDAGSRAEPTFPSCGPHIVDPAMEAQLVGTVAQLTTLRSLQLYTHVNPDAWSPAGVRPHATSVAQLSALTALTSLSLVPSWLYEDHGDSWKRARRDGREHGAWCEVREAHRTSLLSALNCMPQLKRLDCPALWLRPSELAPMGALTSLRVAGLLPPLMGPSHGPAEGSISAADRHLPHRLRELTLRVGASPRALAPLLLPPALYKLDVQLMRFGVSDVDTGGRLRAEAVAAVGPAVRLLTAYRDTYRDQVPNMLRFCIEGDGGPGPVKPRKDAPNGHIEWIWQLQGLAALSGLKLAHVDLRAGDLSCLGQALSSLHDLALSNCSFPAAALPFLRIPMTKLTYLSIDLGRCEGLDTGTLEHVLLLLCRPHIYAAPVQLMACSRCPPSVDVKECTRSVKEQLRRDFQATDTLVMLW